MGSANNCVYKPNLRFPFLTQAVSSSSALKFSQVMKRFTAMLKDVGWLWGVVFAANTGLVALSRLYLLIYPVLVVICMYFTYMRYDEDGNKIA